MYKALLLAGCAGTLSIAGPALAQQDSVDEEATTEGAQIVVTGSRIARQDYESTSPIVTIDEALLEQCVERPEDVSHAFWRTNGILIVKVRGGAPIRRFIANPRSLRAIRNFNLTHMNRGRNAYQASHCYRLADAMLDDPSSL